MMVTCPACSTRYLVDPRALGASGRMVRCTECSHVWAQLPAEDAPHRVDRPSPEAAAPAAARRRGWSPVVVGRGVVAILGLLWFGR